jgi:hypothetical protein
MSFDPAHGRGSLMKDEDGKPKVSIRCLNELSILLAIFSTINGIKKTIADSVY